MANRKVLKEITRLRNVIRKKYKELKSGQIQSVMEFETQFKPLIEPLKTLSETKQKQLSPSVKREPLDETFIPKRASSPIDFDLPPSPSTSKPSKMSNSSRMRALNEITYGDSESSDEHEQTLPQILSSAEGLSEATQWIDKEFESPLTRAYMKKLFKDLGGQSRTIDHTFGPYYKNDVLMMGDKQLHFDSEGNIRLAGIVYKPTQGLYELIFKRIPDDEIYNGDDLITYKDILLKTNAHKKNYKYSSHVNRDSSIKYKYIISKIFPKQLYGRGFEMSKRLSSYNVLYYDDPNELVSRLMLLKSSHEAGNNSHGNEIISIIEELREAGLIKGKGNSVFQSLLK